MTADELKSLEALARQWERWASAKARDAARTSDDFGRRFITHGEICYRNCARELREFLAQAAQLTKQLEGIK